MVEKFYWSRKSQRKRTKLTLLAGEAERRGYIAKEFVAKEDAASWCNEINQTIQMTMTTIKHLSRLATYASGLANNFARQKMRRYLSFCQLTFTLSSFRTVVNFVQTSNQAKENIAHPNRLHSTGNKSGRLAGKSTNSSAR